MSLLGVEVHLNLGLDNTGKLQITSLAGSLSSEIYSDATVARDLALAVGDLDGDGDVDVLIGDEFNGGKTEFHRNGGGGSFMPEARLDLTKLSTPTAAVLFGDYDNDGDLDIFLGNGPAGTSSGDVQLNEVGISSLECHMQS